MSIHRTSLAGFFFESLLIVLFAFPALAQQTGANPGAGFPPFGSFAGSDFDTVNEGNLNIHFAIPIFQKSGRGLSVSAMLNYNGLIWSALPAPRDSNGNIIGTASWAPPSNGPAGWSLNPVAGYVTYTRTQTGPTCSNHIQLSERVGYAYHSPDGTSHYVGGNALEADCYGVAHGFSSQIAQDGSGYSVSVDDSMNAFVTDVGGDLILPTQFEVAGFSSALINPATLTDTNGNQLTASGTGLTDTLGTQAMQFSATTNSVSATYPSPTSPTTFLGVTVNYANYTVGTAFNCFWAEYGPQTWALVSSIQMPDGSSYSFTYEPAGRLASVTLPTGGTIRYTYGSADCSDGSNQSLTRTTPDGQWTYTRQITETPFSNGYQGLITSSITTVTDPLGNVSVINFGPGDIYERKRQIYNGSSTLLETIETCYGGQAFPCTTTQVNSPIGRRTVRKEFPDTSGKVSQTDTYLSSFLGLVTDVYEYDFGSGAPGPLLRHTATAYNGLSANIFYNPSQPTLSYPVTIYNRPATVTVTDGSGTTQSQTSYSYDDTTPAATSGTPQHVEVTGSRGNLTTTKRLVQGTTTIQKTTSYNDTGAVATDTDFNGNSTSYGYGTSSCGNSFPTTVTNPLWLAATTIWDCNGGVATSKTDQNSQTTSFTYGDPNYWRVTQTNFPDGGQVSTVYNLGTNRPWNVLQNTKLTSTQTITNETVYDSLARVSQQQLNTDPDGTTYTDTSYDGLGRVSSRSNPHRSASLPTDGTTTFGYDALNRTKSILEPDGSSVSTSYYGTCATVTDEAGNARKSCSDGLGRLTQVFEDPNVLNYETDYAYDTLNNLTGVTQKGGASSGSWRNRSFTYDSLSRLLTASNPESGVICYGVWSGSNCVNGYDANGNLLKKTDARGITTTMAYDALNRLITKTYSDGTPSASFYFDSAPATWNCCEQNTVGRLVEATTSSTATEFNFDSMGRTTYALECTPMNCSLGQGWGNGFTYNLAGGMTSISSFGITASQTFDSAGRIAGVTSSFVDSQHPAALAAVDSSVGYYPNGAIRKITLGNGLTETSAYNNRLQPCRMNVNSSAAYLTNCSDGAPSGNVLNLTYGFNWGSSDNGNIVSFASSGQQNFNRSYTSYDALNRVKTMSAPGDVCSGLSWTYDAWGNRKTQTVTGGSCFSPQLSFTTKNRLSGSPYVYDAAGNLTNDGFHSYTYDAESRITKVDGGTTASYTYDALGRRVEKIVNSGPPTEFVYDAAGNIFWLVEGAGAHLGHYYVHLNGHLLAEYFEGTTYFAHQDHLGSTRLLTRMDRTVRECDDYYPFGESIPCGDTTGTPHKFTGKERDSESSLDYFGMRHYASTMGRFMQTDEPFADQDTGDPQSWNMYAYVVNNPLRYTDPNGLAHTDANGYWVGDYNGECGQQNGSTVCWNAKANNGQGQWQPKLDNGAVNPGFLGPLDIFFFRVPDLGIMSKLGSLFGRTVEKTAAETAVKTFGEGVTKVGSNALLKDGTKAAARDVIDAMADSAQKASLRRGLQAAGSQAKVSLQVLSDGSVKMIVERPGFSGAQQIIKTVAADGSSKTVQTATDAAGTLVHYDPKN